MLVLAFPKENNSKPFLKDTNSINCVLINSKVVNRNSCKGYCDYHSHSGYLDEKLMKEHKCCERECIHLYLLKNKAKEVFNTSKDVGLITEDELKKTLEKVEIEGFKISTVTSITIDTFQVEYISLGNIDEDKVTKLLETKTHVKIKLKQKKINFDVIEKLFS